MEMCRVQISGTTKFMDTQKGMDHVWTCHKSQSCFFAIFMLVLSQDMTCFAMMSQNHKNLD